MTNWTEAIQDPANSGLSPRGNNKQILPTSQWTCMVNGGGGRGIYRYIYTLKTTANSHYPYSIYLTHYVYGDDRGEFPKLATG